MDPLSVTAACAGILGSLADFSLQINSFVRAVRNARRDMDAVSREISSLSLCLETLHDDCSGNTVEYPPQLKQSLVVLLKNCDTVAKDMDKVLSSTLKSKLGASVSWSTSGSSEMDKLRVRLAAHKASIEIALEMVSMFLIRNVKEDTDELKDLSAAIKSDTEQIPGIKQDTSQISSLVQEIASLRLQVSNLEQRGDNVVLQRFLAESTSYAESAYDAAEQLYSPSGNPSLEPTIVSATDSITRPLASWNFSIPSSPQPDLTNTLRPNRNGDHKPPRDHNSTLEVVQGQAGILRKVTYQLRELKGHEDSIWSVAFSPDGTTIASGSRDRSVRIWDAATGRQLRELKGHGDEVESVAFSPDGTTIASGSRDRSVRIWDAATGRQLRELKGRGGGVRCVAFSPDGTTIASGSDDALIAWASGDIVSGSDGSRRVRIWDAATGRQLRELKGRGGWVWSVAFSPDGTTIASGSDGSRRVRIWDAATGRQLRELKGHGDQVRSVAFSPDGTTIASGSRDRSVRIWDATTGRQLRELKGRGGGVWSVAFSPDGTTIASGSSDGSVRIWDAATGRQLRELKADGDDGDWVRCVAFSPDGTTIASGSDGSRGVRIWDAATG